MSEENIFITVADAELDATIAKIDQALAKHAQLTGQPLPAQLASSSNSRVVSESVTVNRQVIENVQINRQLEELLMPSRVQQQRVDSGFAPFWDMIEKQRVTEIQRQTEAVKIAANTLIKTKGPELKGLNSLITQISSRIPGLREANQLASPLRRLTALDLSSVAGLLSVSFVLVQLVTQMMAEQKQQQEEIRKLVMDSQGFTKRSEFNSWQETQRRSLQDYRTGVIP
jgi:hypothetical protein